MSHHRKLSALVALFLLFALSTAGAADSALTIRIPVESQQPEVREQAVTRAMAQLLIRLTGRDDASQAEAAAPLLEQPGRFLQRYQYESQPGQQLILSMLFDAGAIRRALAERGMPTWRADRPPVLVWLALEQGGRRLLVGSEDGAEVRAQLQEAAARRGVLLLFPLMDSEDQQRISHADVFGGFTDRVRLATERYGTPLMVMGRMYRDGGGWVARWTLSGNAMQSAWITSGASGAEALDAAAAELAVRLATRYAVIPSAADALQQLKIRVVGVGSLRDYDRLERRLRAVNGIAEVRTLGLEPDTVTLQLTLQAAPSRVLALLSQDRQLIPLILPEIDSGQQVPEFRLVP